MSQPLANQQLQEEERIFQQEVESVKNWWKSERFAHITRPYSAKDGKFLVDSSCKQTRNSARVLSFKYSSQEALETFA
jgi:isocitrate lyase